VSDDSDEAYRVGYGKPPINKRFKGGQSGNPKGRPKKIPDLSELIGEELDSTRFIVVDGKRVKLPVTKILVKQLVTLAMKGNPKAFFPVLEMVEKHQKAAARRDAQNRNPFPTKEEISKMTEQEMTALYMKTIKGVNRDE
jgi:hypothetical protein